MEKRIGGMHIMEQYGVQYENQYNKRKKSVVDYLDDVISFLQNQGQGKEDVISSLEKLKENVEHNLFSIVLVGEFSAGKSTFLNALMHKKILPSFTSETTATVNFLRHKDEAPNGEAGIVYYNDGHQEILPNLELETIENVVSTRGDKENDRIATRINHVDLFLDSDFLKKGVMLVDSPGLNGVEANHREITEKQIRASHASIFVFSADHPGSKTDFEFVKALRKQYGNESNNIFYILNKIDMIRKNEGQTVESVVEDLKKSYKKQFPEDETMPHIYPVSGHEALRARDEEYANSLAESNGMEKISSKEQRQEIERNSRMGDFEKRLWKYLTEGEKVRAQLLEPIKISMSEIAIEKSKLEEEQEILKNKESSEELIKEKEYLERKIEELNAEKKKIENPLNTKIDKLIRDLNETFKSNCEKLEEFVKNEVNSITDVEEINEYANSLTDELDRKYQKFIRNIENNLEKDIVYIAQEECVEYFSEINNKLTEMGNKSIAKIDIDRFNNKINKVNKDFEQKEAELDEIENRINNIKKKQIELEKQSIQTQAEEEEIAKQNEELERLRINKETLINNFVPPSATYVTKTEWTKRKRGGLLGGIASILVGDKEEKVEKMVKDTTAIDEAKKEQNQKIKNINEQIEKIEEYRNNIIKVGTSSKIIDYEINRNRDELKELRDEYNKKQEKFIENMKKNAEKACRKLSKDIRYYVEDCSEKYISSMELYLNSQKKEYIQMTKDIFQGNINEKLKEQNQKLEKILNSINTEGKERDERLKAIEDSIGNINILQNKAIEIQSDLENNLNDEIEQEKIE